MILDQTNMEAEDLRDPLWRDRLGTPKRWMEYDGASLITSPIILSTVLTIGYLDSPVPMEDEGDSPDPRIAENHHDHLPLAALYFLLIKDGDTEDIAKANKFLQDFLQFIGVSDGNRQRVPAGR
jgi:hypothetical protein